MIWQPRTGAPNVDAPVLAFGDATAGRSDVMERLAAEGLTGGGEGLDHDFSDRFPRGQSFKAFGCFGQWDDVRNVRLELAFL